MINIKNITRLAIVGAMIAPAAFAGPYQKVVHNTFDNTAHNTFGNCVETMWTTDRNECGLGVLNLRNLSREWRNVYFDFNKSTLNAKEKSKLDQLSSTIIASKSVENVDLTGYADIVGNAAYNKRLSLKRAQTVKSYLATKGLKTRNVKVEGMGESQPVTNCGYVEGKKATKEQIACLAEDRRVEIFLNFVK